MEGFRTAEFWLALLQIAGINLVLAGDIAVVIALATRALPRQQRRALVLGGSFGAVALRLLFCLIAMRVLPVPYLALLGGGLLAWIGIWLMIPERGNFPLLAIATRWGAVPATLFADAVMSLGNAVAIVAVARGDILLIFLGVAISAPLIALGSTLVLKMQQQVPFLVLAGSGLIGWVAGGLVVGDAGVRPWLRGDGPVLDILGRLLGAARVMGLGALLARRGTQRPRDIVDLAPMDRQ